MSDVDGLSEGVVAGDRRALAKAITLVESRRPEDRLAASEVLDVLMPRTGGAVRVGVSGPPGAGKSTLIETLGRHVIELGHRVAVLAVDPSSARTGGSLLGDKTRMADLARSPDAFIRPSPAKGDLGGVARGSREAILLCEAAGFDVVLVETVGVGQSESSVADLVDSLVLLVQPGAGDEIQGMKRGVLELADVVVVTKADGELAAAASRSVGDLRTALHMLRPNSRTWTVPVISVSSLTGLGIDELWATITTHRDAIEESGELAARRSEQDVAWFREELTNQLLARVRAVAGIDTVISRKESEVRSGAAAPPAAATEVVDLLTVQRSDTGGGTSPG